MRTYLFVFLSHNKTVPNGSFFLPFLALQNSAIFLYIRKRIKQVISQTTNHHNKEDWGWGEETRPRTKHRVPRTLGSVSGPLTNPAPPHRPTWPQCLCEARAASAEGVARVKRRRTSTGMATTDTVGGGALPGGRSQAGAEPARAGEWGTG